MDLPYSEYEKEMFRDLMKNKMSKIPDYVSSDYVRSEEPELKMSPIDISGSIRTPGDQSIYGGISSGNNIPDETAIPTPDISTESFSNMEIPKTYDISPEKKANIAYMMKQAEEAAPPAPPSQPDNKDTKPIETTPNWMTMLAMQLIPSIAGYAIGGAKGGEIGAGAGLLANKQYMGDVEKVATDVKSAKKESRDAQLKRDLAMLETKGKILAEGQKFENESKAMDKRFAGLKELEGVKSANTFSLQGGTKKELQAEKDARAAERNKIMADARKSVQSNSNAMREAGLAIREAGLDLRISDKMDKDVRAYGEELSKANIDKTVPAVLKVDEIFNKYSKTGDIPGVGMIDKWNPLASKEGKEMRASITSTIVPQIHAYFGAAQSGQELANAEKMYGNKWYDGEDSFKAVWPLLKKAYLNDVKNMKASANQDAVKVFEQHGGTNIGNLVNALEGNKSKDQGSSQWIGPPVGTIKNGYKRINVPNGNNPKAWEKI